MRILQIVPRIPYPLDDGGKISIANIFRQFSLNGAELTLFGFYYEPISSEADAETRKYGEYFISEHLPNNTPWRIFKSFVSGKPLYMKRYYNKKVLKELEKIVSEKDFDVIHTDHSGMAPLGLFVKSFTGAPVGLRIHNIEWLIWQRYAETFPKYHPKRIYLERQAQGIKKAEAKIYEDVDVCFAITEKEKERGLEISPNANIIVATAGADYEAFAPAEHIHRNPHEMILATTYKWIQNVNAVKWFIDKVLPKVVSEMPEAKLTLIGKALPDWIKNMNNPAINPIGYVDEVQPWLNRANVYVAPLFVGAGLRIKILEAMAMELPVVATTVSAEGIIDAGEDFFNGLFVEDTADDFANAIIKLLKNYDYAREAGKKARVFIINNYSWEKNVGIMMGEYKKLLNDSSQ